MPIYGTYWYGTNGNDHQIFDELNAGRHINASAFAGDDVLVDNYFYFDLVGREVLTSNDYFFGDYGNDILMSGDGRDWVLGGFGDDYLYSDYDGSTVHYENDFLAPGAGNDYVDGGNNEGIDYNQTAVGARARVDEADYYNGDMVYYADAVTGYGVVVDLAGSDGITGIAYDPWGGVDTLVNIEGAVGTGYADYLFGNAFNNDFIGFTGADVIYGAGGEDTLSHYLVNPTSATEEQLFPYSSGVIVDLGAGYARDPWWYYDTLISIENVNGTALDDILIGSEGDNVIGGGLTLTQGFTGGSDVIWGMGGNDTIVAGTGASIIFGGDGSDTIFAGGSDIVYGGAGADYFLLDPRVPSEAGPDYIADFNDAEDFIIVSSDFVDRGGWIGNVTDDSYILFDYTGHGVTGAYVQFQGTGADHYVFVENVTAAQLADNFISDTYIYIDYSV